MRHLRPIFLASFFFSIHVALLTYLNSSMLSRFGAPGMVSTIYLVSSVVSVILLIAIPEVIRHRGLIKAMVGILVLSSLLLFGIGVTSSPTFTIGIFILYFSLNVVITYFFDLLVEHYSAVTTTGKTRGLFLMINNIGWIGAPFLAGIITGAFGFNTLYLLGGSMVLVACLLILITQRGFKDRVYQHGSIIQAFRSLRQHPAIRRIVTLNLLLQLFYTWMVVYSPLYLRSLGFDWRAIGIMFSIMLIPFVLFQYPTGKLADRYGEKPIIQIGLFIISLATICFSLLTKHSIFLYAGVLFATRTGASIIEVGCDSYFFKHTSDKDTAIVSLYRAMYPFAYIIGPLTGAGLLLLVSYQTLFLILASGLLLALLYSFRFKY